MTTTAWRSTTIRSGLSGIAVGALVFGVLTLVGVVVPAPGAAAADGSAVTISAADLDPNVDTAPFPDLRVTVSQTQDLVAQGIRISWTGGSKSTVPSQQTGGEDFLQFAQCWGDDPDDPSRPDRTTCQFGGTNSAGTTRDNFREDSWVAPEDEQYTAPGDGLANPTYTSIPFRSVTGETVASVVDHKQVAIDVNTNEFFTRLTTNEVAWAGSGNDGSGTTTFEVQTAMQAPGLGCGTPVSSDPTAPGRSCWLVVIPRGVSDNGTPSITQSGLFWDSWQHAIGVKLQFKPLGDRCPVGAAERQLAGSELVSVAISSWQPSLCMSEGGAVYSALSGTESDALLAANGMESAPLALTSRALKTEGEDQLQYAPIALTGLTISFAIDREPRAGGETPQEYRDRARLPMTSIKLTPRLVAKLLTNSYTDSLPTDADKSHLTHSDGAGGTVSNPRTLTYDPEFLEINDEEWAYQALVAPSLADLLVPQGRSDAAWALWSYLLADGDAKAFLAGTPDPWGMRVNPYYSTTAKDNPSGAELTLPREDFPKADPTEQAETTQAGPINIVTWRPYVNDFDSSAYLTLRGDGQLLGAWDPISVPPKYGKTARSLPGLQRVLGLTDTASAARYQVYTAELRNPAGEFVGPDTTSMLAAAAAMTADPDQIQVLGYDASSEKARQAPSAYPLTMPVYAAARPALEDDELRADYAAFIRFASGSGQTPGTSDGQLPAGYAPLPKSWRAQATASAAVIEAGVDDTPPPASSGDGDGATDPLPGGSTVEEPPVDNNPDASGEPAGALTGDPTPDDPEVGGLSATVPLSLLSGVAAAIATPLVSRRRVLPWSPR
ncbi:hypothetical protein [Homoserinibacter sp. GY 40078]|uniref:hypothetical protein n=1 Tax=Homoserinibacter sp. GY 40078 TaxID=2603275 RepID=UPI0011CA11F5|nr:hypothetical protein [Homoserinibacter sp. GY 40078]TXK19480.1 hypothetical protein FVQ89_06210 [Homoserinibacter sp. GY 40078]